MAHLPIFDAGNGRYIHDAFSIPISGVAHEKGSYTTASSQLTCSASGLIVAPIIFTTTNRHYLIDIALGSGDPIINNLIAAMPTIAQSFHYYFPIHIPAGTFLRVRCQTNSTTGTINGTTYLIPSGVLSRSCESVDTYGANTATSKGTTLTPGSSSAKGSYVALSTGIRRNIKGIVLATMIDTYGITTGSNYSIDIATGNGSATRIIVPDIHVVSSGVSEYFTPRVHGPYWVSLRTHEGIWVRAQSALASPNTLSVVAYCLV